MVEPELTSKEGQESAGDSGTTVPADNSLGRLLTLCDGVFAIAMTLLALDLKVPDLADGSSDAALRHALSHNAASYLSFLVSFYVVANYWRRHRRLMRSVVKIHPRLFGSTMALLLIVAALPFFASLLGEYGNRPTALALYAFFNGIASLILIQQHRDVRRYELLDPRVDPAADDSTVWVRWRNVIMFAICIPGAYLLGGHGPFLLLLLALPDRFAVPARFRRARRA